MEFKSQVCTTKEQSYKLLQLGLKESTADCHWFYHLPTERWQIVARPYGGYGTYLPAWSLHRLIELLGGNIAIDDFAIEWAYDTVIDHIAFDIRHDEFNYEYLEEKTMKTLTFGAAIEALKQGKKVTRMGWNGKGMYLWLKPATTIKAEWCKDPMLKEIVDANGGEAEALGTICMKTADNKILTGWLASQTDMLSEDWMIIE